MTMALPATANLSRVTPGSLIEVAVFAMLGAANGYVAWNADVMTICLAPIVVWLWAHAPSRWSAAAAVFAYCMAYQRDIPQGASIYFGGDTSILFGLSLCTAIGVMLALPWLMLWPKDKSGFVWRVPVALAAVIVPPFGIVGGANPLMAAGVLFPATGWLGLALIFAIMLMLCYRPRSVIAYAILAMLALSPFGINQLYTERVSAWKGIDTQFKGVGAGELDFVQSFSNNGALIQRAISAPANTVVVFPETVAGMWTQTTASMWEAEAVPALTAKNTTALVGASIRQPGGEYDNAVVAIGDGTRLLYKQRVPIPVAMWKPYATDGARAYWMADGIAYIGGKKAAMFVCYEQLLMWPALLSFAQRPDIIVAPANAWMNVGTSVPSIQKNTMRAWARLFDVPLVTAFNY